ncbi:conserved hypothetical protein [Streptomyces pristinaespiralis ATCC 25486]|uniref:Uncharacterized protein n=1 Tax=Streptomyces pristinaespiralis (strain ATCC 25486 / DSM 40338 / CBS 914.69 / JCM 4507 / KCC S-0507 / NBRC 13074 / NRRL 2958 / 5647) TaxID=457429 RepID=B5HKQ3_STRE2|nr:conserved hypothetical protein [Streptomyces pristinaespiralis ATCC 25486]
MDGGRDGLQTLLRRLMHKENCHTAQSNGTVQVFFRRRTAAREARGAPCGATARRRRRAVRGRGAGPATSPARGRPAAARHVPLRPVVGGGCQTETQITSESSSK